MGLTLIIYGFAFLSGCLFIWARVLKEDTRASKFVFILASGIFGWFVVIAVLHAFFYYWSI